SSIPRPKGVSGRAIFSFLCTVEMFEGCRRPPIQNFVGKVRCRIGFEAGRSQQTYNSRFFRLVEINLAQLILYRNLYLAAVKVEELSRTVRPPSTLGPGLEKRDYRAIDGRLNDCICASDVEAVANKGI